MTSTFTRSEDGSVEITITVPWVNITKLYDHAVEHAVEHAEIQGFRKGKAPRKLVEEKLDKTHVYEDVLRDLIPKVYNEAITEHKLQPVVNPKIELLDATEEKDWKIRAITAEKPKVSLGKYKEAIREVKAAKANKIWTPKDGEPSSAEATEGKDDKKPTLDELLKALFEAVKVSLPAILIEHEANRLLSDLIDQTKKLGLTVEQYLSSTGRTGDTVHKEYEEQATRTLTLEFALEEIADTEGVLVSDDDIDAIIKTAKSDEEKESLAKQKYYLASVLRRQKTLDFIAAL